MLRQHLFLWLLMVTFTGSSTGRVELDRVILSLHICSFVAWSTSLEFSSLPLVIPTFISTLSVGTLVLRTLFLQMMFFCSLEGIRSQFRSYSNSCESLGRHWILSSILPNHLSTLYVSMIFISTVFCTSLASVNDPFLLNILGSP